MSGQLGGTLRGGLAFNGVFAVEAGFSALENADGVIIGAGDVSGPDFTVVREPDRVSAAFARASWPPTDRLSAHARLGFARLDATNETGGHDNANGAAFGVGASLAIRGPTALRLDYTRMALGDLDADVGTLMFAVRF